MTDRPRILIFSLAYFPQVGGAEVAVKEITDRLNNYDLELICLNFSGQEEKIEKLGNILVRRVGSSRLAKYFYPWLAVRLAKRLHEIKPYNLVWAIMANQAGIAGTLFKKHFPAVPLLLTLQEGDDLDSFAYRLRLLGPRWFQVFKRANHIQAISHYLARWGRKMGARCPITVVPNGVDLKSFQLLGSSFQLDKKEKVIITTSRLVKKNGIDILIEAMRFLPENVKLLIVGSGPEFKKLEARSYKLGLNKEARVKFLGNVDPQEVPKYLTQADVFVRPSRSEGLGNSFLEAMAAGLPTVGTPVGGIPDFLRDPEWQGESLPFSKDSPLGQTGWLCRVNDPKDLAGKVEFILDDSNQALVESVTTRAKALVHEKYDWIKISQQMAQIMDKLLEKS